MVAVAPTAALVATPSHALTGDPVILDASGSTDNGSLQHFEWDLDGDGQFERDTGAISRTETSFTAAGDRDVRVRVTDDHGHEDTASVAIAVSPRPPAGPVGVSINDGAQFTNDADVTVHSTWPAFARTMLFANDGGFQSAERFGVVEEQRWRLDASGPERLPKTIYVRFGDSTQTFQDDIILDQTPPNITSIRPMAATVATQSVRAISAAERRISRRRIRVAAKDNVSGVKRMQVTASKRKPGAWRGYRKIVVLPTGTKRRTLVFVRVSDAAGNASRWRAVRVD